MRTFSIFACLAGLSLPDVIYSAHLTIFHDMFDEFNPLGLFSILFGMMIPSGSYFGSWSNESLTPMGATQCRHVNANRACLVVQHWWPNPNVLEVSSPKPGRLAKRKRRSYLATSRCMYIYIHIIMCMYKAYITVCIYIHRVMVPSDSPPVDTDSARLNYSWINLEWGHDIRWWQRRIERKQQPLIFGWSNKFHHWLAHPLVIKPSYRRSSFSWWFFSHVPQMTKASGFRGLS